MFFRYLRSFPSPTHWYTARLYVPCKSCWRAMFHLNGFDVATRAAREIAGHANVHEMPPLMAGEDFSYMLEQRPGALIFCGNGDSAGLHHPAYNFNDEAIVFGTSYWIKLVENTLAV